MRAILAVLILTIAMATSAVACTLPPGGESEFKNVITRTNAYRAQKNRPALSESPDLTDAAQNHACHMAATGQMTHTGAGGSLVSDRAEAEGYRYGLIAENIAQGYPGAASVVQGWITSRGHRRNMELREARDIGIGLATRGSELYWVMVLGARM